MVALDKDDILYNNIECIFRFGSIKAYEENKDSDVTNISFDRNFIVQFL